jgi:CRP/FNR family transcriptional regulator
MFYEALESTTVWLVPREQFIEYISHDSEAAFELLEEMVDRYNLYSGRIDNLLYSDARERSAYRLLSLANRFGTKTDDGLCINVTITHEDLAHSINMTRETFGRSFGRLQKRDIIGYDERKRWIIKDLPALVQIIGREETEAMWPDLIKFLE